MSREAHVRFWEGVGVQLLCATQVVVIDERPLVGSVEVRRLLQRDPDPLIVGQGRTRATECGAAEPGQAVWWRCHAWVGSITNTSGERREPSREKVEGTSTSGTASSIAGDRMRRRHDHSAGGRSSAARSQCPKSAAASYTLW